MLQKIIPDLIIDARDLATADAGHGKTLLGKRSLSDSKMLTRGGSSGAYVTAPLEQGAAVDRRQQRGANGYVKRARELDRPIPGHQPDEEGPFTKKLKYYGENGRSSYQWLAASSKCHRIPTRLRSSAPLSKQTNTAPITRHNRQRSEACSGDASTGPGG